MAFRSFFGILFWSRFCVIFFKKCKESKTENIEVSFFTGIPTPAGAILILLPLTHSFIGLDWINSNLNFVAGYIILISGLLVSKIPTFSIKSREPIIKSRLAFLIVFSAVALSLINFPWQTLNLFALMYILSIPFSVSAWLKSRSIS